MIEGFYMQWWWGSDYTQLVNLILKKFNPDVNLFCETPPIPKNSSDQTDKLALFKTDIEK